MVDYNPDCNLAQEPCPRLNRSACYAIVVVLVFPRAFKTKAASVRRGETKGWAAVRGVPGFPDITKPGAEESNRVAAEFVKNNPNLARLISKPEIIAGSVGAHYAK